MRSLKDYILNEGFKLGKNKVDTEDDAVDLDLPSGTLWCKYNVGAKPGSTAESWYGDYFMWGDIKYVTNKECDWKNYKWCNNNDESLSKYCYKSKTNFWDGKGNPDNKLVLDLEDDMANANMKGDWKMPTKEQFQELIDNTTSEWLTDYNGISGLNGRLFTSKTNNNTLFIPAAGLRDYSSINSIGFNIVVWSSSLFTDNPSSAYVLSSYKYDIYTNRAYRISGCSVRGIIN